MSQKRGKTASKQAAITNHLIIDCKLHFYQVMSFYTNCCENLLFSLVLSKKVTAYSELLKQFHLT